MRTVAELDHLQVANWTDEELQAAINSYSAFVRPINFQAVALEIEKRANVTGRREINSQAELAQVLVGRRIVAVERTADSGEDFGYGENNVRLFLDDGSAVEFHAHGYDASRLETEYVVHPKPPVQNP